jgi:hypothetical protein
VKIYSEKGLAMLEGLYPDISPAAAARRINVLPERDDFSILEGMIHEARTASSPKAFYKECFIEGINGNAVVIGGVEFRSRVLCVNLKNKRRVFAYVVTAGRDIVDWSGKYSDPLKAYFADYISGLVLESAIGKFFNYVKKNYRIKLYSTMAPGALEDWPVEQQALLFKVMGDVKGVLGVELTESCLMIPAKSASGLLYPDNMSFKSCMLCARVGCADRKAPYDELFYKKRSGDSSS